MGSVGRRGRPRFTCERDLKKRLTGRYRDGDCCGEAKATRVSQRFALARFANVYAYGDSPEDHALLRPLEPARSYRWKECGDEPSPG